MSPLLEARGIGMTFRNGDELTEVLKGVDLTLEHGELAALLGASGSGKSTLLSIVGLLLKPTAGTLSIAGQRVEGLPDLERAQFRNRRLGFIFQFHHLLPEFSALDNVAMPLTIRRDPPAQAQAVALDMLRRVGLAERAAHRPAELSGGERQRVAIARALVTRPDCVLADEPTGNLDRSTADGVFDLMLQLARDQGTAFVLVTHDATLASKCSRRMHLDRGVLRDVD